MLSGKRAKSAREWRGSEGKADLMAAQREWDHSSERRRVLLRARGTT